MLRRLRNWEIFIVGKIRDGFIEEIVFDFSFEKKERIQIYRSGKGGKGYYKIGNSKINVLEMCLYRM